MRRELHLEGPERAGLVVAVTGSGTTSSELLTTAHSFPGHLRVAVVRADVRGRAEARSSDSAEYLTVPSLDALQELVHRRAAA